MKKAWIPGYTKDDGTKVKGHYRNITRSSSNIIKKGITENVFSVSKRNGRTKIVTSYDMRFDPKRHLISRFNRRFGY